LPVSRPPSRSPPNAPPPPPPANGPPQDFQPHIHLSEADYAVLTQDGALCDAGGGLGPASFEAALRRQIALYHQRKLSDALVVGSGGKAELLQVAALKAVLLEQVRDEPRWL
jgi:hypothetical protein